MKSIGFWQTLAVVAASLLAATPAAAMEPLKGLAPNSVILFQGDSITDGGRWPGNDYNHIMGQDYGYIIAAEIGAEYPERNLTFLNRGVSGNTVVKLNARWQADTLDLKPDLLSILVGVNDTLFSDESAETFEQTYDKLIGDTLAAMPNVKIVLGEPFLLPAGNQQADYAARLAKVKLRAAIVSRLAAKYHLPLVHYQAAFDAACQKAPASHWSWDGVHPTYAGHALMAHEWLRTVDAFWPKGQ